MNTCPHCRQSHDSTACPTPLVEGPSPTLFRRTYEEIDGKMEPATAGDLFVWAAVNNQTGEVEMDSIHPYDDELSNEDLAESWEWRRFRLVEAPDTKEAVDMIPDPQPIDPTAACGPPKSRIVLRRVLLGWFAVPVLFLMRCYASCNEVFWTGYGSEVFWHRDPAMTKMKNEVDRALRWFAIASR